MFFGRVELSGGGLGAAGFIPDRVAGAELVGIGIRPPFEDGILADEQLE